jgi:hypothetical protein
VVTPIVVGDADRERVKEAMRRAAYVQLRRGQSII